MEPDGTIEMGFRHSKETPLELVDEVKDLLMQELGVSKKVLRQWEAKVDARSSTAAAPAADPAAAEPSTRARARARQKANEAARKAAADEAKAKA